MDVERKGGSGPCRYEGDAVGRQHWSETYRFKVPHRNPGRWALPNNVTSAPAEISHDFNDRSSDGKFALSLTDPAR